MKFYNKLKQLERIDHLIRRKSTGNAKSLASRLDVSERNVYTLLKVMKEMGAPIYFCYIRNSYCYQEDVVFLLGFLPNKEVRSIEQQVKIAKKNFH